MLDLCAPLKNLLMSFLSTSQVRHFFANFFNETAKDKPIVHITGLKINIKQKANHPCIPFFNASLIQRLKYVLLSSRIRPLCKKARLPAYFTWFDLSPWPCHDLYIEGSKRLSDHGFFRLFALLRNNSAYLDLKFLLPFFHYYLRKDLREVCIGFA